MSVSPSLARSAPLARKTPGTHRAWDSHRRGRLLVLFIMLASGALVAFDSNRASPGSISPPGIEVDDPGLGFGLHVAGPSPAGTPTPVEVVREGTATFAYAAGTGAVAGRTGSLRRYRVAVEDGLGLDQVVFATAVEAILADPRSWITEGTVRLQRVAGAAPADFTIYLASPVTSERMCREEWLETGQFTNCRLSTGKVIINSARWLTAVPDYGAPLSTYQHYAINHEVGHQLGHRHELCPRAGAPAPVMQQQTLGLQGCLPNGWPYVNGTRYRGPAAGS